MPKKDTSAADAEIRERKKQEELEKKARNIQGFKKWLKEPSKGVSSAKEKELDKRLREQRNSQYEYGEGWRERSKARTLITCSVEEKLRGRGETQG